MLLPGAEPASETTQRRVDDEVRRIVEEAHARVTRLLTERRDQLESLTAALLARRRWTRTRPTPRLKSTATAPICHGEERNFSADARL